MRYSSSALPVPDVLTIGEGFGRWFAISRTPAADAVTAIFSWKCANLGDAIYELAWCTFWGRWHAGIGALKLWERVVPPAGSLNHSTPPGWTTQ